MSMDQQFVSYSIFYSHIITFYIYISLQQLNFQEISLEEANRLVGSLKSLYTGLILKGYYLPKFQSSCVTSEYLLGVALNKVFTCKSQDIKVAYLIQKATKIDLYRELFQLVGQEVELGFTSEKLPNRDWLVNTLYLVSPNHQYFKQPNFNMLRGFSFQDIQKLKDLNTSMYRSKRLRIFKSSIEELQKKKAKKVVQQMEKVKTQLEEGTKNQTNMMGKLQKLKTNLKEFQQGGIQQQADDLNSRVFQMNFELQEEFHSD